MIRYFAIACFLKAFSLSAQTRKAYRFLGNRFGARWRMKGGLSKSYIERAKRLLRLFEKYDVAQKGARCLELGTGWIHWESTVLRLFYNAKLTLYDVWDNRQFQAFRDSISEFRNVLAKDAEIMPSKHTAAMDLADTVVSVNSFNEVYDLLGFQYVVEPTGTLRKLEQESYDVCFSCNVFEHIDRRIASEYIKDLYRLLKPGGYTFITIDISDHLANYDRCVSRKHYLQYSDTVWKLLFENDVQYFNRIQRGEWLSMFSQAGFELMEEESVLQPVPASINRKYKNMSKKDIECTTMRIVHRKPQENGLRAVSV